LPSCCLLLFHISTKLTTATHSLPREIVAWMRKRERKVRIGLAGAFNASCDEETALRDKYNICLAKQVDLGRTRLKQRSVPRTASASKNRSYVTLNVCLDLWWGSCVLRPHQKLLRFPQLGNPRCLPPSEPHLICDASTDSNNAFHQISQGA
jgi:hypothetical protein